MVNGRRFVGSSGISSGGGSGGGFAELNQTTPSTSWTFQHNLGQKFPIFQIFDSNDKVIIPSQIIAVSSDSATITFPSAQTGRAIASLGTGPGGMTEAFSAATTWSVSHNMGADYPIVTVYDSNRKIVFPNEIRSIDADNVVREDFFNVEVDMDRIKSNDVISWAGKNTVNGLVYGNGGIKCWPVDVVNRMRTHEAAPASDKRAQVDFCWNINYVQMNNIYCDVMNNASPLQAWRAGFREGVKMGLVDGDIIDPTKLKFGNITSGGLSFSTSFKSKSTDGKETKQKDIPIDPFMTPDEQQRQLQYAKSNPAEFTDFNIPWTLTVSYSFQFSRYMKPDYSGFQINTYSSLNFNGDFSITPKWKLGGTGYIDVAKRSIQQLSMFITREMHCWQLAINVTPIGLYKSFSITVNPKSGILRDLKINRSRTFSSSSY